MVGCANNLLESDQYGWRSINPWNDIFIGTNIYRDSKSLALIGWGFDSPLSRDIFCLKNFDAFARTSVRVSKMDAVVNISNVNFTSNICIHIYICVCVSMNWGVIDSCNGLMVCGLCDVKPFLEATKLLIERWKAYFAKIWMNILLFSSSKTHFNMSFAKNGSHFVRLYCYLHIN